MNGPKDNAFEVSRRSLLGGALVTSIAAPATLANAGGTMSRAADFDIKGIYLNAASAHPLSRQVQAALRAYTEKRSRDPLYTWRLDGARDEVAALYARLINAAPADIAVVPSTMIGENLICAALGIGPGDRIVTDDFHYFASLIKYGEMRKQGVDVVMVAPRGTVIRPEDLDAAITHNTKLVAISLVASRSGFVHDLSQLCEIAHQRGALVYADVIQAAGAMPIDVRASGVDFVCGGGHKWLQADHGAALLYVRPQSMEYLHRVQVGWQQMADYQYHAFATDPPGPAEGNWRFLPDSPRSFFEVSTFSYQPLWALRASLAYILDIGVEAISQHRRPLMARLHAGMREIGYTALTPGEQGSPIASFARATIDPGLKRRCLSRGIALGIGDNVVRIAPSVYNDLNDIEALLDALS